MNLLNDFEGEGAFFSSSSLRLKYKCITDLLDIHLNNSMHIFPLSQNLEQYGMYGISNKKNFISIFLNEGGT